MARTVYSEIGVLQFAPINDAPNASTVVPTVTIDIADQVVWLNYAVRRLQGSFSRQVSQTILVVGKSQV